MRLTFHRILGSRGAIGPVYRDVTRDGDTTDRAVYIGRRADRARLSCRRHFSTLRAAREWIALAESAQGHVVELVESTSNHTDVVFLHRFQPEPPRAIEGGGYRYTVAAELEVQRRA